MIRLAARGGGALAAVFCAGCAGTAIAPAEPDLLTAFRYGCIATMPDFAGAGAALAGIGLAPTGNDGVFDIYEAGGISVGVNAVDDEPAEGAVCVAVDVRTPPRTGWAEVRAAVVEAVGAPADEACDSPLTERPECTMRWRRADGCLGLDTLVNRSRVFSTWLFFQPGRACWA